MAARTIDELVVSLALDPRKFEDGRKRAEDELKKTREAVGKTSSAIEGENRKISETYQKVTRDVTVLFATIIGAKGVLDFTTRTTQGMVSLANAANLAGVSVQNLSSIAMAAQRVGGDPAAAVASMQGLASQLELWKIRGQISPELLTGLNQIGGTNPNESATDVVQQFGRWAKGKDPRFVNLVGQQLGLDPGLIALSTRRDMGKEVADTRRIAPTDDDAKKLDRLNEAFVRFRQETDKNAREVLEKVAPAMAGTLGAMQGFEQTLPGVTQGIIGLTAALIGLEAVAKTILALRLIAGGAAVSGGAGAAAEAAGAAGAGAEAAAGAAGVAGAGLIGAAGLLGVLGGGAALLNPGGDPSQSGAWKFGAGIGGSIGAWARKRLGWDRPGAPAAHPALIGHPMHAPSGSAHGGNEAVIGAFLLHAGLTADQAAGVLAGIGAETAGTFSEMIKNPGSSAYGIGQWMKGTAKHPGRQANFARWAGHDIHGSSLMEQLKFLIQEPEFAAVRSARTSSDALKAYIYGDMKPGAAGAAQDLAYAGRRIGQTSVVIQSVVINDQTGNIAVAMRKLGGSVKHNLARQVDAGLSG